MPIRISQTAIVRSLPSTDYLTTQFVVTAVDGVNCSGTLTIRESSKGKEHVYNWRGFYTGNNSWKISGDGAELPQKKGRADPARFPFCLDTLVNIGIQTVVAECLNNQLNQVVCDRAGNNDATQTSTPNTPAAAKPLFEPLPPGVPKPPDLPTPLSPPRNNDSPPKLAKGKQKSMKIKDKLEVIQRLVSAEFDIPTNELNDGSKRSPNHVGARRAAAYCARAFKIGEKDTRPLIMSDGRRSNGRIFRLCGSMVADMKANTEVAGRISHLLQRIGREIGEAVEGIATGKKGKKRNPPPAKTTSRAPSPEAVVSGNGSTTTALTDAIIFALVMQGREVREVAEAMGTNIQTVEIAVGRCAIGLGTRLSAVTALLANM